jgi:hypothetical protein
MARKAAQGVGIVTAGKPQAAALGQKEIDAGMK